jgi:hypothetical protein
MQIMLYKGFTILTNTKHDLAAPETAPDMLLAIVAQNIRVIVSAFILGTLMHYLVKKDPEIKAMKELMADLDQYCAQRHLPHDLATKMKEHINYQQRHSSAVSSTVQQVQYSCLTPCIMPALQDIVAGWVLLVIRAVLHSHALDQPNQPNDDDNAEAIRLCRYR